MVTVRAFTTSEATRSLLRNIRRLLDDAFEDFDDDDWANTLGGWHVVVLDGDAPVSHAAVVPRTLEVADRAFRTGYVEGVATSTDRQGAGLGSRAMARLNPIVRQDFELGALSTGRHRFYERLGWQRWRGPTFVRSGAEVVRSVDEDDGVMVLRFGPSAHVDLTAPITCEARRGDDW